MMRAGARMPTRRVDGLDRDSPPSETSLKAGDVIISQREDGNWATTKILAVDSWQDGSETFHCLCYEPAGSRPTESTIDSLRIRIHHAPMDAADFKANWQVLGSRPINDDELVGFAEYLRHTDFPRYLDLTGQDGKQLVENANAYYNAARALGEEGKVAESIQQYSEAIALFPFFFEAIDNRAFAHMDLGDFRTATADFEASLQVNPEGHAAFFSRGECFLKLGEFDKAEEIFLEGADRFPEHRADYLHFLALAKGRQRPGDTESGSKSSSAGQPPASSAPAKQWWKFWS
jgi:tetratricopeptide (TPR) repeat protein